MLLLGVMSRHRALGGADQESLLDADELGDATFVRGEILPGAHKLVPVWFETLVVDWGHLENSKTKRNYQEVMLCTNLVLNKLLCFILLNVLKYSSS